MDKDNFLTKLENINEQLNLTHYWIIFLKYKKGKPVINSLKSVSKPSLRIYYSVKQLWKLDFNQGLLLLSRQMFW